MADSLSILHDLITRSMSSPSGQDSHIDIGFATDFSSVVWFDLMIYTESVFARRPMIISHEVPCKRLLLTARLSVLPHQHIPGVPD